MPKKLKFHFASTEAHFSSKYIINRTEVGIEPKSALCKNFALTIEPEMLTNHLLSQNWQLQAEINRNAEISGHHLN